MTTLGVSCRTTAAELLLDFFSNVMVVLLTKRSRIHSDSIKELYIRIVFTVKPSAAGIVQISWGVEIVRMP